MNADFWQSGKGDPEREGTNALEVQICTERQRLCVRSASSDSSISVHPSGAIARKYGTHMRRSGSLKVNRVADVFYL